MFSGARLLVVWRRRVS